MDDSALFSTNKQIILLSPDALALDFAPDTLADFVDSKAVRCIVRADDERGFALAMAAHQAGLSVELLLSHSAPDPDPLLKAWAARMPPGGAPSLKLDVATLPEADYLALLMSDALFVDGTNPDHPILIAADRYGKPQVSRIAEACARVAAHPDSDLLRLDPLRPSAAGRRSWATRAWRCVGRAELRCTSLFALLGMAVSTFRRHTEKAVDAAEATPPTGFAKIGRDLLSTVRPGWDCEAWFAPPEAWPTMIPDDKARAETSAVARFAALDRAARFSARAARDVTWIIHAAAVVAVLLAVIGHLWPLEVPLWGLGEIPVWPVAEIVTLGGFVLFPWALVSRAHLQPRWMAARLGAEQIRVACLCLPLLLLPPSFAADDRADAAGDAEAKYRDEAMALAKRAIRDHGLPFRPPTANFQAAANWISLVVEDQIQYHRKNFRTLENAEFGLKSAATIIFMLVLLAVAVHFVHHWKWLLLVTAGGPALAAALHALGTRLDMVNRVHLSKDVYVILTGIRERLAELAGRPESEETWTDLRKVTLEASEAIASEHERWHRLIQLQAPELP